MILNVIMGILMRRNFQFMKVNNVNINPKAVFTFVINKNISVLPLWRHVEQPLVYTKKS